MANLLNQIGNVSIAIVTFLVALTFDYYIVKTLPALVANIDDSMIQGFAYAGIITLVIAITVLAPIIAVISKPVEENA